jgi:hypothetical protein
MDGQDWSDRERTLLCVSSRRAGVMLDRALSNYRCCVVHDTRVACRKAKLGAFDLYLAVDPYSSAAVCECWRAIREFDANTPFVLVVRGSVPVAVQSALSPERDGVVTDGAGSAVLADTVAALLAAAERRSLDAKREETLAIREDIRARLSRLEWRLQLSRESMARAQEHVMRAYALRSFTRLGGTKSFFERLWPDAYEEALRTSADRERSG